MNTTDHSGALERNIDAALARLPEWQPPQDFSTRLAAAAARQAAAPVVLAEPAWSAMLDQITSITPIVLASAALAATLGWIVPWSQLSGVGLVWTCVAAMTAAGAFLTMRVLRTA
jgi:hypothetical protein